MIAPGAIAPFSIHSRQYYSQAVQEALDKFPNPLADGEASKIAAIINLASFSGNWEDAYDYFFGWFLTDEANALTSWKGTKTATNVSDSVHTPNQGFLFDGIADFINTNITPSTDLTNASLNDIHATAYCFDNLDSGNGKFLFGTLVGVNQLLLQQSGGSIFSNVNSSLNFSKSGNFLDKTRYGLHRVEAASQQLFVNGVQAATDTDISNGLSSIPIFVGCRNTGVAGNFINAEESYFLIGGGFDLTALNTELNLVQSSFNLN